MNSFNENDHPRLATSGRFATKDGSAPDAILEFLDTITVDMRKQRTEHLLETYRQLDEVGAVTDMDQDVEDALLGLLIERYDLGDDVDNILLDEPGFTGSTRDALLLAVERKNPAKTERTANETLIELVRLLDNEANQTELVQFNSSLTTGVCEQILTERSESLPANIANLLLLDELPRVFRVEYAQQHADFPGYADYFIRDADPLVRRIAAQSPNLTSAALDRAIAQLGSVQHGDEVSSLDGQRDLRDVRVQTLLEGRLA